MYRSRWYISFDKFDGEQLDITERWLSVCGLCWYPWVVMFTFISNNQHGWFFQAPFYMLPCRTTSHAATFIISPANVQAEKSSQQTMRGKNTNISGQPFEMTKKTKWKHLQVPKPEMDFQYSKRNFFLRIISMWSGTIRISILRLWIKILRLFQEVRFNIISIYVVKNRKCTKEEPRTIDLHKLDFLNAASYCDSEWIPILHSAKSITFDSRCKLEVNLKKY